MDKTTTTLRVGGVPEHFNFPWMIAIERGLFSKHGVNIEWVEQKEGTGQMINNAKAETVDVIIALTEGLVADIAKGSELRLLGTYVESPLCWAISTGASSSFETVEDLKGQKFGVSRFTSGSHLMAFVLASERGWNPETDISFEIKGNFENLRNSVNDGSTAAFMWETFTTKPYHDSGEIRRIGEITTPWPCFMVAALRKVIDAKQEALKAMFSALREACDIFHNLEKDKMPRLISERYGLKLEDAEQWYAGVKLSGECLLSEAALDRVLSSLSEIKIISSKNVSTRSLCDERFAKLQIDIKKMRLYNKPELVTRMFNELRAAGLSKGSLSYKDLLPFDQQHHYHGTDAIDTAIRMTNMKSKSNVISMGSGLGGPARYIAATLNCQVLAIDIQDDLNATASELTNRCNLSNKVHHICGDFLKIAGSHLRSNAYDAIVSWLTVLHITDRQTLFKVSYDVLKPGGYFYAEDFFDLTGNLTPEEKRILEEDIYCKYLPQLNKYKQDLLDAGFVLSRVDDLTDDWRQYTKERVEKFDDNKAAFVKVHGEDIFNRLRYFYSRVRDLYANGNLGGVRVVAQKPLEAQISNASYRLSAVELDW